MTVSAWLISNSSRKTGTAISIFKDLIQGSIGTIYVDYVVATIIDTVYVATLVSPYSVATFKEEIYKAVLIEEGI